MFEAMFEIILFLFLATIVKVVLTHYLNKLKKCKKRDKNSSQTTKPKPSQKEQFAKNIKKGKEYEEQISRYFANLGYKVYPNGKIKGKMDAGIDLIAHKDNETILIQCKNHQSQIKQELLRICIGDCHIYEKENAKFLKNRQIKRLLVANSDLHSGAKLYLQSHQSECEFIQIPASCND